MGEFQVTNVIHASAGREVAMARFRQLFDGELDYVWSSLRRLGIPESDTEDLCHEVFLRVFPKLESFDHSRPAKPWLFAFAFRVASDYRKHAKNTRELPRDDIEAVSLSPNAEALLEQRAQRALVSKALDAVELERRAVLIAHDVDEISMKDIAESMTIPVNTAYSRLRVAREEFANAVRRLEKQENAR